MVYSTAGIIFYPDFCLLSAADGIQGFGQERLGSEARQSIHLQEINAASPKRAAPKRPVSPVVFSPRVLLEV